MRANSTRRYPRSETFRVGTYYSSSGSILLPWRSRVYKARWRHIYVPNVLFSDVAPPLIPWSVAPAKFLQRAIKLLRFIGDACEHVSSTPCQVLLYRIVPTAYTPCHSNLCKRAAAICAYLTANTEHFRHPKRMML